MAPKKGMMPTLVMQQCIHCIMCTPLWTGGVEWLLLWPYNLSSKVYGQRWWNSGHCQSLALEKVPVWFPAFMWSLERFKLKWVRTHKFVKKVVLQSTSCQYKYKLKVPLKREKLQSYLKALKLFSSTALPHST